MQDEDQHLHFIFSPHHNFSPPDRGNFERGVDIFISLKEKPRREMFASQAVAAVVRAGASGPVSEGPGPGAGLSARWTGAVPGRTGSPVSRSRVSRAGAAAGTTRSVTSSAGGPAGGSAPSSGQPAPV